LWCYPTSGAKFQIGSGAGSVTWADDLVGSSGTDQWVAGLSGQGGSTAAIPLRSGAYISATVGQPIIGDGTNTFLSTITGPQTILSGLTGSALAVSGSKKFAVNATEIDAFLPIFNFGGTADVNIAFSTTQSTGPGAAMWINGQQTVGTGASGNVNARVYSPATGTTEAMFQVVRNASSTDTVQWAMGQLISGGSVSAIYGPVTPGTTNYAIISSGSTTVLNGTSIVELAVNGTVVCALQQSNSDAIKFGAHPSGTGFVRFSPASGGPTTIIGMRNVGLSADIAIMYTDLSNNITFGDGTANCGSVQLNAGSGGSSAMLSVAGSSIVQALSNLVVISQVVNFTGGVSSTATGGFGSLPANPVGFLNVQISGTARRIPYYNT
jgi:hypothetical protein